MSPGISADGHGRDQPARDRRRTPPALSVRSCACQLPTVATLPILAMTGTGGQSARSYWPALAAASALAPADHAHVDPGSMADVRSPAPRPMSARSCVRRPNGRHDRTGFRTPHAQSHLGGHRHRHPARHRCTGRDADSRRTIGTAAFGHSSTATTTTPAGSRRNPHAGAGHFRRGDEAAARSLRRRSVAPRRTALLGTNFGSSVERTASLHPLWRYVVEVAGCKP
jgi:hypothetical protein